MKLIKKRLNVYELLMETQPPEVIGIGVIIEGAIRLFTELRDRVFMEIAYVDAKDLMLKEVFNNLNYKEIKIDNQIITKLDCIKQDRIKEKEIKQKYNKLKKALNAR